MKQLNDISFLSIIMFAVQSITIENASHLFRLTLSIGTLLFSLVYMASKISRKTTKKKLISGTSGGLTDII